MVEIFGLQYLEELEEEEEEIRGCAAGCTCIDDPIHPDEPILA